MLGRNHRLVWTGMLGEDFRPNHVPQLGFGFVCDLRFTPLVQGGTRFHAIVKHADAEGKQSTRKWVSMRAGESRCHNWWSCTAPEVPSPGLRGHMSIFAGSCWCAESLKTACDRSSSTSGFELAESGGFEQNPIAVVRSIPINGDLLQDWGELRKINSIRATTCKQAFEGLKY